MAWHLLFLANSEIDEVIVVAGHHGDQVQELCDSLPNLGMTVTVIHESDQRGTVAALTLGAQMSEAEEFLVILGDILMSLPVDDFVERWRRSAASVGVAVHPSTHPQDSDAVFPSHDGTVIVVPKSESRNAIPNMSSAGLFIIDRVGLKRYESLVDFGSDVLLEAASRDDLYADVNSHYFKDTGTPERLAAAEGDFQSGAFARRGSTSSRPALFLDRDGVINPVSPEVYDPDQFTLNMGIAESIREANQLGLPIFVVTNQPGISKGFMNFGTHESVRAQMDAMLAAEGAFVDDYAFCPHHPESGFANEVVELKIRCRCRKPEPGLLIHLAKHHRLNLTKSAMVGDTDRDAGAAHRADVTFFSTHSFTDGGVSEAILRAIEVATC